MVRSPMAWGRLGTSCNAVKPHAYLRAVHERIASNRAVACVELGLRCKFVARGRQPDEVVALFWNHARTSHSDELTTRSPSDKETMHNLVEALSTSRRHPRHRRADTTPGLRDLVASGDLRRWWC